MIVPGVNCVIAHSQRAIEDSAVADEDVESHVSRVPPHSLRLYQAARWDVGFSSLPRSPQLRPQALRVGQDRG